MCDQFMHVGELFHSVILNVLDSVEGILSDKSDQGGTFMYAISGDLAPGETPT